MAMHEEIEALRAERDEWRRRAEISEALAGERLTRAERAETALRAAEAALFNAGAAGAVPPRPADDGLDRGMPPPAPVRPGTLRERWRRYTETIN